MRCNTLGEHGRCERDDNHEGPHKVSTGEHPTLVHSWGSAGVNQSGGSCWKTTCSLQDGHEPPHSEISKPEPEPPLFGEDPTEMLPQ